MSRYDTVTGRIKMERNMAIRLKEEHKTEALPEQAPPEDRPPERRYGFAVRRCQFCNKAFEGTDRAMFCGAVCRKRSHRKNKPAPRIRREDIEAALAELDAGHVESGKRMLRRLLRSG